MMALYSQEGINPVGGCLPMFAQLPVFLVLFNVLRGLSRRVDETPFFAAVERAREIVGAPASAGQHFDPKYLDHQSEMYLNLSGSEEMRFLVFDLANRALDVIQSNIVEGIPYVLLILFVVATSYYQQRQMSARRKNQPSSAPSAVNTQQEMILKFLPILSGVWSFVFPLGLVMYWATSNVCRIGQQAYITRTVYRNDGGSLQIESSDDDTEEADKADSGGVDESKIGGVKGVGNALKAQPTDDSPNGNNDGRNGREAAGNGVNETGSRSDRWEQMRQQKARKQAKNQSREAGPTSRTTPKGTKPGSKSKRKR